MANDDHEQDSKPRIWLSSAGALACAAVGALYAVIGVFPVAALVALVFRFPIPFVGYESGFRAMTMTPRAVLLYGLVGGFYLLAALGAIAGLIVHSGSKAGRDRNNHGEILIFAAVIDIAAVLLLSVWDKIYGPW
jgi:hypothetical protein